MSSEMPPKSDKADRKKVLQQTMKLLGYTGEKFTGQVTTHWNEGGITAVDRLEKLKE
jgi:hypothetical protein